MKQLWQNLTRRDKQSSSTDEQPEIKPETKVAPKPRTAPLLILPKSSMQSLHDEVFSLDVNVLRTSMVAMFLRREANAVFHFRADYILKSGDYGPLQPNGSRAVTQKTMRKFLDRAKSKGETLLLLHVGAVFIDAHQPNHAENKRLSTQVGDALGRQGFFVAYSGLDVRTASLFECYYYSPDGFCKAEVKRPDKPMRL